MKKIIVLFCIFYSIIVLGQETITDKKTSEKPFIEVTGTAMKEVIPDIIYITITLSDKVVNNEDYSILIQEEALKNALTKANIDLKNLSLSDAISEITKDKKRETGFKVSKEYIVIVKNSVEVTKVFKELYAINIKEARITRTESSEIETLRKEVRIAAIKAAKEKAVYLLNAIGEQIDKPLEIKELENKIYNTENVYSNSIINLKDIDGAESNFEKIVIKFSYFVRFSIK